jgi:hypothetical protein
VLQARCFSCHGALKQEAGLRLDTGHFIRKGSRLGKIVIPGRAEESRLLLRVLAANPAQRMPPEGEALKPEEAAALKEWIAQGAVTPAAETPETDPRRHWSFLPVTRPTIPKVVANPRFPIRNPIDAFVAAEAGKRGLTLATPAEPETLLRRVYVDLTGVPPTRAELQAFRTDRSPNTYEKVVDRLLASPAYGERWGRHWMDVWRYSDWYGRRKESDVRNSYGQMWRWRDWIVRSLNADKPYDQMVVEMLAADEADPENDEAITATGFLVRNWYSLNYNQWMRDNVEHTGKAFLGLTLNCAHCHDHKYDPISQQEYFKFRAFFEPLELRHDRWPGDPDPGPFKKYIYGGSTAALKSGMIRVFDEKPDARTFLYRKGDERERFPGEPTVEPGAPAIAGGQRLKVAPVALPGTAYYPGLKEFIQQEETARARAALTAAQSVKPVVETWVAVAQADLDAVLARIAADNARFGRTQGDSEALSRAASKVERIAKLRAVEHQLSVAEQALAAARAKAAADTAAAAQTALKQAEAKATEAMAAVNQARQAAAAESAQYTPLSPEYPKQSSGRRLALARWIASRENPLTARVAVNHIWMRHFGRPLVETVFDFGRNGKPPTHPALLDWLADYFVMGAGGQGSGIGRSSLQAEPRSLNPKPWQMKALHRLIVTSSTYRMSSTAPEAVAAANARIDSENRYLWRYYSRRVEAEVLRDSILSAAGTLDNTLGGPELDNTQENTRRRSLYYSVYAEDGGSMRFLTAFDAPNTCDAYRRTESVVPQQALAIVNSRLTLDQGRLLARALWKDLPTAGDREAAFITAAFEQVLTRSPSATELKTCREFLQQQTALFRASGPPVATSAGIVAPSADPQLRAAESLAQALFSHNDFVTIR